MQIKQIVIHHSVSSRDNTRIGQINEWHKARDFTLSSLGYYVGYHYVIFGDGTVVQARKDNEMGCHCIPNEGKLGICLTGNFMIEKPSEAQLNALKTLLDRLCNEYGLKNSDIKGHRELYNTSCPGDELLKWILQNRITWLKALINKLLGK